LETAVNYLQNKYNIFFAASLYNRCIALPLLGVKAVNSTTLKTLLTLNEPYYFAYLFTVKVKLKGAYSSLQTGLPSPLQELTYHMGSHSVTCHPAEVTFPPLPQPKLVLSCPAARVPVTTS